MTIVVCAGVFMVGLLSNYMIGRHAYINESVGKVQEVGTQILPLMQSITQFQSATGTTP